MTTLLVDETPSPAIRTAATKLFVTWICSLLWGFGIFLPTLGFMAAAIAGLMNLAGPPAWDLRSSFLLIAGFVLAFFACLCVGTFITRNWRKGFTSSLLALLMAAVGFFLFYEFAGFLYLTFSIRADVFYSLFSAVPAALAVLTILLWHRLSPSPRGLALGLSIGLGITLVDGVLLGRNLFASSNIFHLLWQVPPLTWISIVLFSEPAAVRNQRNGLLTWSLLVLVTFGVPFLVVPLFGR